jgi:hypothetical protein
VLVPAAVDAEPVSPRPAPRSIGWRAASAIAFSESLLPQLVKMVPRHSRAKIPAVRRAERRGRLARGLPWGVAARDECGLCRRRSALMYSKGPAPLECELSRVPTFY